MKRKLLAILLIIIFIINISACTKTRKMYTASFLSVFNTVTKVIAYDKSEKSFKEFSQFIYDELNTYHQLYDKYKAYNNINNIKTINDMAGIGPVSVDEKIIDLLEYSIEMHSLTKGKVNIAMGSVLKIWHEYREYGINNPFDSKLPSMDELTKANLHVNINNIIINKVESTVYLKDKDMSLDVGAIAKGYATEMVALAAKEKGYSNFLLNVGGNVRTIAGKENLNDFWNVGIRNPFKEDDTASLYILNLNNLSLVSSGDYERYYTVDGNRYHHIIDPNTLMPANYFSAVSILCEDSGLADSLSTAIYNMTLDEGKKLIESLEGVEALWILKDKKTVFSSGFANYLKKE